ARVGVVLVDDLLAAEQFRRDDTAAERLATPGGDADLLVERDGQLLERQQLAGLEQIDELALVSAGVLVAGKADFFLHLLHGGAVAGAVVDAVEEDGELVEVLFRPLVVGVLVALSALEADAEEGVREAERLLLRLA